MKTENTMKFDAEIGRVLNLVINSIYTNKDIFLRELVSNSSDAISKLKFLLLENSSLLSETSEPEIKVSIDRKKEAIIIRDNGIGMNREDLIKNIGTIANSGTLKFIESLKDGGSQGQELIGQFGVGFYSAFMVSKTVEVKTRKAGEGEVFLWKSDGKEDYTLEKIENTEFTHGTEITLYLKDEEKDEYLDKFRIEHILKTYSNHITTPIILEGEEGISSRVNNSTALWVKNPSEVKEEEYLEFYKSLSWAADTPFLTLHNKVEGAMEYTNLLFLPSARPLDLYNPERKSSTKLYVKRVFIAEDEVKILPEYLRFVKGVIDSPDMPLNISRETLQNNSILTKIGKSITKKILGELKKKLDSDKSKYLEFWKIFGNVIKEGLCRPEDLKENILSVCLFYSSLKQEYVTLDEYLERMKQNQESIYFLTADSITDGLNNPHIELFKKNDIEVLILVDTTDDFWTTIITDYKSKSIKNIASSDEKIDELLSQTAGKEKTKPEEETEEGRKAVDLFARVLASQVQEVKISQKLVESPVCLSQNEGGMSIRMERYLMEQKQLQQSSKKVLEINLKHPVIQKIVETGETEETTAQILTLFDLACVASGEALKMQTDFVKRVFDMMQK